MKSKKIQSKGPKRPKSVYLRYCDDKRPTLPKMSLGDMGKLLGEMWSKEDEKVKEKYNKLYQQDVAKYDAEMEEFKKTPEYAQEQEAKKHEKAQARKDKKNGKSKREKKVSAYNIFMKEHYANAKKSGVTLKIGKENSELTTKWKNMSQKEKEVYEKKALEMNQQAKGAIVGEEQSSD
ncbi:hypothetical protein EDEG_02959 [Edhazardia aedis USNM 41457]|uniref:HMG box domain-containing protein n=1 Tax=Edhazardia aedis (strain USNM 41457) TaxID=1003232 RepID=J9D536_EDHAE|nr:hypothetical protein EDEG_02959 [Edhazardia aedis USNM 41457]|eukprot:EJW02639.1 hypothetical protein EDEG_02959 [Edhazardia aedis USNM 41457]